MPSSGPPLTVQITDGSIDYIYDHIYPQATLLFYVAAVSFYGLLSSHRIIRWFGMATAASLVIAILFYKATFISVWCFFAALISAIVYWFFRDKRKRE